MPGVDPVLAQVRGTADAGGFPGEMPYPWRLLPWGNVCFGDRLTIWGVGDVGYSTVVGDRRMDLAGAVGYLELVDSYRPEDTIFLTQRVEERHGRGMV